MLDLGAAAVIPAVSKVFQRRNKRSAAAAAAGAANTGSNISEQQEQLRYGRCAMALQAGGKQHSACEATHA
jgi:hypothetical protein